jgi:predicted house-cleaning noncanonical NTP pyrophosphatase (MazG superfamily)
MKIITTTVEISDCQSDSAIFVANDRLHILNSSALRIYEIIEKESPDMKLLLEKIKEDFFEDWEEKNIDIISDLFEILVKMKEEQLINFVF